MSGSRLNGKIDGSGSAGGSVGVSSSGGAVAIRQSVRSRETRAVGGRSASARPVRRRSAGGRSTCWERRVGPSAFRRAAPTWSSRPTSSRAGFSGRRHGIGERVRILHSRSPYRCARPHDRCRTVALAADTLRVFDRVRTGALQGGTIDLFGGDRPGGRRETRGRRRRLWRHHPRSSRRFRRIS